MSRLTACLCALALPAAAAAEAPDFAAHVAAVVQPTDEAPEPLLIDAAIAHPPLFGLPIAGLAHVRLSRLVRDVAVEEGVRHVGGSAWSVAVAADQELRIFGNILDVHRENVRARVEVELGHGVVGTGEWRLGKSSLDPFVDTTFILFATAVVHSLAVGLRWDTRDDALRPSTGGLVAGRFEIAPALGLFEFELPLRRVELEVEDHVALASRVHVHVRTRVGQLFATGRSASAEAWFAGGPDFVRGTAPGSIVATPAVPRPFRMPPSGGDAMLSGTMELEVRVLDPWRVAAFFDVGETFTGGFPTASTAGGGDFSGGVESHVDLGRSFEATTILAMVRHNGELSPFLSLGLAWHTAR